MTEKHYAFELTKNTKPHQTIKNVFRRYRYRFFT